MKGINALHITSKIITRHLRVMLFIGKFVIT